MIEDKKRKRSKTRFTATHIRARYTGTHPHLMDSEGVYYYSKEQGTEIFRPDREGSKADWYRVFKENLEDLE